MSETGNARFEFVDRHNRKSVEIDSQGRYVMAKKPVTKLTGTSGKEEETNQKAKFVLEKIIELKKTNVNITLSGFWYENEVLLESKDSLHELLCDIACTIVVHA